MKKHLSAVLVTLSACVGLSCLTAFAQAPLVPARAEGGVHGGGGAPVDLMFAFTLPAPYEKHTQACLDGDQVRIKWRYIGLERAVAYNVYRCSDADFTRGDTYPDRFTGKLLGTARGATEFVAPFEGLDAQYCLSTVDAYANDPRYIERHKDRGQPVSRPVQVERCDPPETNTKLPVPEILSFNPQLTGENAQAVLEHTIDLTVPAVKTYVVYSFNEAEIARVNDGKEPTAVELPDHAVMAMQEYSIALYRYEDSDCREDGPFTCRLHNRNSWGLDCRRPGEPQRWYRVAAVDQKNNPGLLSRAVPAPACSP